MRSKLLSADPPVTYALVLDTDDEVATELGKFVRAQEVEAASITAIGAFRRAVLGYFQWDAKKYKKIMVEEQVEVLSLLGDVAVGDQGPTLHLHAVLGKADPLGAPAWVGWVSPAAGFVFLGLSLIAWRAGVRHYTSTGS